MSEVPRLFDLCMAAIRDELPAGDDTNYILAVIFELPSELFDSLLPFLPPLALQKLQENLPLDFRDEFEPANDNHGSCQKRKRYGIFDTQWRALHKLRWPRSNQQNHQIVPWLDKHNESKCVSVDDWQQIYWEAHLQDCVDAVAETALLPSYNGSIGEILIPDSVLEYIGCKDHLIKSTFNYLRFSNHFQDFGIYTRCLRLPNVLCVAETCHLLQSSKLESLELQWIKSNDHVEGLCKLLKQNSETLKSIDFIHCKLSPTFVDAICDSCMKGLQTHGIEHFSIKRSSFLQTDSSPLPIGLASFLKSGRFLYSLTLCDAQVGRNFARLIFNKLLDLSACISILDLSENNIAGFLSQFRWKSKNCSLGVAKSLHSLRVLNLRNNNLLRDDIDSLRQALVHMPNLETLDLSDNPIEDGIRSLIPYFAEISDRVSPFVGLKLENCELTCNQVIQLFDVLSTMKTPLNLLSVKGNHLGSKIGTPLGKFICTGIRALDVEDIGLGSLGFLKAQDEISKELKLVYMNISNNQGGIEAAKFMYGIILHAYEVVAIDARYNLMPVESLSVISSGLKVSKGKMKHLDLAGNLFCDQLTDAASVFAEFRIRGQLSLDLSLSAFPNVPYDDDP